MARRLSDSYVQQVVRNHYMHEESLAAGRRVFWIKDGHCSLKSMTTAQFANWLGVTEAKVVSMLPPEALRSRYLDFVA